MRALIFANGNPTPREVVQSWTQPGSLRIAADGGTRNALAAGVNDAPRGFVDQRRMAGIVAIDKGVQREAEARPLFFGQFPLRHSEARPRGDTATVVAPLAVCLVQHGQNLRGEVVRPRRARIFLRGQEKDGDEDDGSSHCTLY